MVTVIFDNLGKLYQAFSVHQKHKRTHTSTLQEAGEMMKSVSGYLQGTVQSVQTLLGNSKETNGPEGTVASKTIRSVNMINQGLTRLQSNIAKINPELTVNPEALLTVKVENLHAVSHFKHPSCMQLHYARDFATTALESAKRMTQWSAFYFTHSTSYYPVPSTQIHFQDFPRMTKQNLPVMSSADQDLMRKWANTHGKCVRQRTVRQETTKYEAGTLPLNMYQTAVHRGERLEFAPVEPEFSNEEGTEGTLHRGTQEMISFPNTMTTPPTTTVMILQWRKMVQFVMCRTNNSVSFLHRAEREVDGK